MNNKYKKSMLVILDGWGHGKTIKSDAIAQGNTPFIDHLASKISKCRA